MLTSNTGARYRMRQNYGGPTIIPPGGDYDYNVNGERVRSFSRDGLINGLTELRQANNKKIGDPAKDIDSFLRSSKTGYSAPISVAKKDHNQKRKPRLIERVNAWVMNRYSKLSNIVYVNQTEAQRRASICIACPKNRDWKSSCVTCHADSKKEIERNVVIISQNKQTPQHSKLKACVIAGHENKAAVFLAEPFLLHRKTYMELLPERCWMRGLDGG